MTLLRGALVTLRPAGPADVERLVAIRSTPEVHHRWGGDDLPAEVAADLTDDDLHLYVIEVDVPEGGSAAAGSAAAGSAAAGSAAAGGEVVGAVQWSSEEDPQYRHAGIDIYVDPAHHGRGIGTDAVRTLARHLLRDHGYHRLTIDPAADNAVAIACYAKVGFRPVGVMRQYERGPDGTWHDGLLMDLLAPEFVDQP
ncbi:GNAT family N-acetyltransferase [Jiangella sp. DSM 45060]|uniref:GNAT family N-acetyltransferase n=1 Tax=Jiangella sp. DSM 45060 TaxID=1798224 RepID=UPI00087CA06C|nr:GNAT family protein [Jiangella sp. DSM 45060]SDT12232.1 aminoglycoside 6'-N-acetyltransferase [Jiangella sp. DSM 45060]